MEKGFASITSTHYPNLLSAALTVLQQESLFYESSPYNWKAKYSGMEASDVKRLMDLEEENHRLQQMYTELSLDHEISKEIVEKHFEAIYAKGYE